MIWRIFQKNWDYDVARRVAWIVLAIAVVAYYPRFAHDMSSGVALGGLPLLRHGAECLLGNQVLQDCDLQFTYPPAFAFLMIPFYAMGAKVGMVIWYAVAIVATIASYQLCEAFARRLFPGAWSERELAWLRVVSISLSIKFILAVLENQAFDTLVLLFILVGLWGLLQKRELVAGIGFAFAAAIKGSPLIFLPYLLVTRRFMAFAVFVVVYLVMSFLPDLFFTPKGAAHGYFATWIREIAMGPLYDDPTLSKYQFWYGGFVNNHAMRAWAYRMFPDGLGDPWFRPVLAAMYLPVVAAVCFIVWRSMRRGGLIALDGAAVTIAMLVMSPMTSRSHFVALMLPYVVCSAAAIRDVSTRRLGVIVLTASFLLATMSGNDLVGGRITDLTAYYGALSLGSLVLLIYLAVIAHRSDPATKQSASAA